MPELLGVWRAWNNLTTEPDSDFNFPASYMCFFGCVCRVMFGTSHLYVFHHPAEAQSSSLKQADITYEMAQEEIAKNAGLDVDDQESKGEEDVELSTCWFRWMNQSVHLTVKYNVSWSVSESVSQPVSRLGGQLVCKLLGQSVRQSVRMSVTPSFSQ